MRNKQTAIWIIDNDPLTRERVTAFISSEYRCTSVASAEEARELLTFSSFDLVITERDLRGRSGLALCQFVKRARPDKPTILMAEEITAWQ